MSTLKLFPVLFFLFGSPSLYAQWTQSSSGTTAILNSVEVVNADTAYAGGIGVFLRSVNGGQSWASLPIINTSNQPINGLVINDLHFFNALTGVAVGARSNTIHTILRTTDGGLHWTPVLTQTDPQGWYEGILKVDFINSMQGWCVGASGKVRRTLDGGVNWTDLPDVAEPNLSHLIALDFADAQVGYTSVAYSFGSGLLLKTTNGGQSWNTLTGGQFAEMAFVHPDTGFIANENYSFRMKDGDLDWDFLPIPDEALSRGFVLQNGNSCFMLTDNGVRRTQNGGQFWEESRFPGNNPIQMRDFDWAPGFLTGIAVGHNGRIYRTSNGGGTSTPMAFFQTDPQLLTFCKDQVIQLVNPAPEGLWTAAWWVDGALFSTANDVSVSFSEYGSSHTVQLLVTNGIVSDTFQRIIQIEPALTFQFGEVQWLAEEQICQGGTVSVRIQHPAQDMNYALSVNDVIVAQQIVHDTSALVFQTPALNEGATLKVFASLNTPCGSNYQESVLEVEVLPFPNTNLNWSITPYVCVNSQATITIENSEPGIGYWLMESGFIPKSDTVTGTGGTLSFFSYPLTQPVAYQIRASNAIGCSNWIGFPLPVNIDFFYLNVDTTHLYGVEGTPVFIENGTDNLGASNWTFGNAAQPPTSEAASPFVIYENTGTYPFIYQYQSQLNCQGSIQGNIQVFAQAPDLDGASCWSQRLINAAYLNQSILDVKVDPQGNYWVTGATFQQVSFWYTMNLFLNKYDASGVLLWSKQVNPEDPANSFDYRTSYGISIDFDPNGNAYLAGSYNADNVRIFGVDFTRPTSFFSSYSQGFLFKLNSSGDVIWHSNFQATQDYDFSIPTDLVVLNDRIHLMLRGNSWQMFQPDGNLATNSAPGAAAWYIAVDTAGNFIHDLPVVESFPNMLLGGWNPENIPNISEISTVRSPRLLVSPTGSLLVNGGFYGLADLEFGGVPIEPLDTTFSGKNHFIAVLNPEAGTCENAFCAFSVQTPQHDFPAWEVDGAGDIYLGFGLNPFSPVYTPSVKIGQDFSATTPNRSYITKFSETGSLLWQQKHTDQFFTDFVKAPDGGIRALSRFNRSVGFHMPDGTTLGTTSNGGNDLLLSGISADGSLQGLQNFGGFDHEQPIALVAAGPNLVGIISADDLNASLNFPPNAYTLRVWSEDAANCPEVSVSTVKGFSDWHVSPNPFSNSLTCTFHFPEVQKNITCTLRTIEGRSVWSHPTGLFPAGEQVIHVQTEHLPAGLYLFEIATEHGTSVRKLVKWKS